MFSDAGGALARRRRDSLCSSLSFCNHLQVSFCLVFPFCNLSLLSPCSHDVALHKDNINRDSYLLSLVWNVPWPTRPVKEETYLFTCSPIMKSENCLQISRSTISRTFAILVDLCFYRIPSKSNMPSSCPLTKWSYAMTSEPVMNLTAEGSDPNWPSLPLIAYGGAAQTFPTGGALGFCLLGPPHYSGPPMFSWPIDENINSSTILSRPRFNYFTPSLSPIINFVCLHGLSCRRLFSCPEATKWIWRCEYLLRTLLLRYPRAKVFKTLHWKIIYGISSFKFQSIEDMVYTFVKPVRLSQCVPSYNLLPVTSFINYPQKHLGTESIERPHPRFVSSLPMLQFSRTMVNCSRQTSNAHSRIPILPDFESLRRPSFLRRIGSDLNSQGQSDYKLCVEFLNLHGQRLHVREDPPALLRLVTHQMRFPVSSSSKVTSTCQPSNPLVSSMEHTFKSSYASIVRAKYDHLLVRDFLKLVFKLESYKTSKDLPSLASSSRLCIFLEDSCSLYLYISCNPLLRS